VITRKPRVGLGPKGGGGGGGGVSHGARTALWLAWLETSEVDGMGPDLERTMDRASLRWDMGGGERWQTEGREGQRRCRHGKEYVRQCGFRVDFEMLVFKCLCTNRHPTQRSLVTLHNTGLLVTTSGFSNGMSAPIHLRS
jgi:hypothetical protein